MKQNVFDDNSIFLPKYTQNGESLMNLKLRIPDFNPNRDELFHEINFDSLSETEYKIIGNIQNVGDEDVKFEIKEYETKSGEKSLKLSVKFISCGLFGICPFNKHQNIYFLPRFFYVHPCVEMKMTIFPIFRFFMKEKYSKNVEINISEKGNINSEICHLYSEKMDEFENACYITLKTVFIADKISISFLNTEYGKIIKIPIKITGYDWFKENVNHNFYNNKALVELIHKSDHNIIDLLFSRLMENKQIDLDIKYETFVMKIGKDKFSLCFLNNLKESHNKPPELTSFENKTPLEDLKTINLPFTNISAYSFNIKTPEKYIFKNNNGLQHENTLNFDENLINSEDYKDLSVGKEVSIKIADKNEIDKLTNFLYSSVQIFTQKGKLCPVSSYLDEKENLYIKFIPETSGYHLIEISSPIVEGKHHDNLYLLIKVSNGENNDSILAYGPGTYFNS